MNKEFRDFLKSEYDKMTAKEQKAADVLADEEKTTRQKGAQKAAATKAQRTFMDMLTKKLAPEEPSEEPESPESPDVSVEEPINTDEPTEPTETPDVSVEEPRTQD